ncbi:prenyltransferase [Candidatus Sumerlaeota bacterium]|nr:prenyltransferase [Candidatus Sumerlaeota bacterium]
MLRIKLFFRAIRAAFLPASVIPVISAAAYNYYLHSSFRFSRFFLHLFCTVCFHSASNVMNDYDDYRSGCDAMNRDYISPFTGGSRMIQEGLVSPDYVKKLAMTLFGLGILSGMILTFSVHYSVAIFFPPALIGGYFYARFFARYGFGEIIIFLHFGILTTLSAFYVQSMSINAGVILLAVINGIFVMNILVINETPDMEADRKAGKKTIMVRYGKTGGLYLYLLFYAVGYGVIGIGAAFGEFPVNSLGALFSIILCLSAFYAAMKKDRRNVHKAIILTIANQVMTGLILTIIFLI